MSLNSLHKHVTHKKARVDTPRMAKGTIYYCPKFVHKIKKTLCELPIFIIMWLISWLWRRLRKTKRRRFNLLLCFICWGRVIPWQIMNPLNIFSIFSKSKTCPKSIGLITWVGRLWKVCKIYYCNAQKRWWNNRLSLFFLLMKSPKLIMNHH
jgi:hypothetical protein